MRIYRALPLALVCLAGCGGPSLVGKWNMSGAGTPPGSTATTDFTANTFKTNFDFNQGGMSFHVDVSGDYTFDGKKLRMTGKSFNIDDSKLPAAIKSQMGAVKGMMEKEMLKTDESEIKIENDTFTMTGPKGTMTFTKVKA